MSTNRDMPVSRRECQQLLDLAAVLDVDPGKILYGDEG